VFELVGPDADDHRPEMMRSNWQPTMTRFAGQGWEVRTVPKTFERYVDEDMAGPCNH
jgi:hypothetical protein